MLNASADEIWLGEPFTTSVTSLDVHTGLQSIVYVTVDPEAGSPVQSALSHNLSQLRPASQGF